MTIAICWSASTCSKAFARPSALVISSEHKKIHLLNNPAAVHLQTEPQDVPFKGIGQQSLLNLVSLLKELLDDIVGKDVSRQLENVWHQLVEHELLVFARCRLQFLLDMSGPELISSELHNVTPQVLFASRRKRHVNI
jgi:hypothetical protein